MTLTEEQRDAVAFDLEKARAALEEAIDRMSPTVSDEDGFIWEADPEQTAILQEMLDRIGRYTNNDYLDIQYQLDSADTEIERLRAENEEALESLTAAYLLGRHEKAQEVAARIKELEEAKLRSWQITEERKAALAAMSNLSETISCPDCGVWIGFADIGPHMAVLRTMLAEAEQCE